MFKKIFLVAFAVVLMAAGGSKLQAAYPSGFSLGAAFMGGYPGGYGGVITIGVPGPLMIGFNLGMRVGDNNNNWFNLNVLLDFWLLKLPIGAGFHFYLGPGLALGFNINGNRWYDDKKNEWRDSSFDFDIGVRLPIGISFLIPPLPALELYIELAPGIHFLSFGDHGFWGGVNFAFGGQLGFRYWF